MPRLTLVTSVLNGMPHLAGALDSIGDAGESSVERLVVDAGSTDGTLALLRRRPEIRLIERPGLSLYEAWNVAVAEARGSYIGFLNADDALGPGGGGAILAALETDDADVLCGGAEALADEDGGAAFPAGHPRYRYASPAVTGPTLDTFLFGAPILNAKIFRRSLFDRAGGFDATYSIAADRDFLLRLLLVGSAVRWLPVPAVLYRYRIHPGSTTLMASTETRLRIAEEHRRMVARLLAAGARDPSTASAMRALAAREGVAAVACLAKRAEFISALGRLGSLARGDPLFFRRLRRANAAVAAFRNAVVPR